VPVGLQKFETCPDRGGKTCVLILLIAWTPGFANSFVFRFESNLAPRLSGEGVGVNLQFARDPGLCCPFGEGRQRSQSLVQRRCPRSIPAGVP
jgi:hypothetical protein